MNSIAVVGIGNNLLQDDGAGIHVLTHFEKHHSDLDVDCLDAGTVGLALMDRVTNLYGLIAVDAMRLGKPPGTVTVLEGEDMDAHLLIERSSASSPNAWIGAPSLPTRSPSRFRGPRHGYAISWTPGDNPTRSRQAHE
jgi:Ni,Fe-hydrogenase maturation factor